MDINLLVNITSRAWSMPILACMHDGVPGRQAALLTATGASRTAFAQSMAHLVEIGMLERNPGHGHPLRPEFRLTPLGVVAAEMAHQIQLVTRDENQDLLRRSWTLPVLTSLRKPSRFNGIKRQLTTITDRALSQCLVSMQDREWIERNVDADCRPPMPVYSAINTGRLINRVTRPLVSFPEL